jgi:pimeloyl-ACP methyl ester carboxylesterase
LKDYLEVLRYTMTRFPDARIIIYGHSLGGSVAVCLLSQLYDEKRSMDPEDSNYGDPRFANIRGLILENSFCSIPEMTRALYPDRWTPYHYMGPLALDKWDALSAIRDAQREKSVLDGLRTEMMVLVSENDEVVPKEMGEELWKASRGEETLNDAADGDHSEGLGRKVVIRDALHENAWMCRQWLKEMTRYISEVRARP